jgi:hypothetical protein
MCACHQTVKEICLRWLGISASLLLCAPENISPVKANVMSLTRLFDHVEFPFEHRNRPWHCAFMNAHSLTDHHVSASSESSGGQRPGRAFAARLDMTIKRSRLTSQRVAKSLGVTEGDVALWRAGITLPRYADCRRLSELLHVDVSWLSGGSAVEEKP